MKNNERSVTVQLPYPPSVNHYWGHRRDRVYLKKEGINYRVRVAYAIIEQVKSGPIWLGAFKKKLKMTLNVIPPDNRMRDLDNILKAMLDALESAQVYENDNQIDELHIYRKKPEKPGCVVVEIHEL